jgi:Yip1 domain
MADNSSVSVLVNIFTAPSKAFASLRERPNPWLALAMLVIGSAAVSYLYLQVVDLPWMLDRQVSQGGNLTDEQRKQAVDAALQLSPTVYGVIGALSAVVSYLIFYALIALYFTGVSFATNDGVKYRQWFAMISWSTVPLVFGLVASFVNLLVTDARFLPPEQLNPLSFGNLLGINSDGATLVERSVLSLSIIALWIVGLLVVGHQVLSQRSIVRSAVVVLAPLAAIVLISAAVAAL